MTKGKLVALPTTRIVVVLESQSALPIANVIAR
jgi:hypothetical protein